MWPTLGSRTAKDQIRDLWVSLRRVESLAARWRQPCVNGDWLCQSMKDANIRPTQNLHPLIDHQKNLLQVIRCLPTVILIIIGIPSPTHSFTLGLNPSFSANPPYYSLSFFSIRIHYMDFPDCLLLLLSISVFLLFSFFSVFTIFSCRFRAV